MRAGSRGAVRKRRKRPECHPVRPLARVPRCGTRRRGGAVRPATECRAGGRTDGAKTGRRTVRGGAGGPAGLLTRRLSQPVGHSPRQCAHAPDSGTPFTPRVNPSSPGSSEDAPAFGPGRNRTPAGALVRLVRRGDRAAAAPGHGAGARCGPGRQGDRHHHIRRPRPPAPAARAQGAGEADPVRPDGGAPQAEEGAGRIEGTTGRRGSRVPRSTRRSPGSGRTPPASTHGTSVSCTPRTPPWTARRAEREPSTHYLFRNVPTPAPRAEPSRRMTRTPHA